MIHDRRTTTTLNRQPGIRKKSPACPLRGLSDNCAANSVIADPASIGAASGLYGSMQLAYGALCTIVVGAWHGASVLPLATAIVISVLIGQFALNWALRRQKPTPA